MADLKEVLLPCPSLMDVADDARPPSFVRLLPRALQGALAGALVGSLQFVGCCALAVLVGFLAVGLGPPGCLFAAVALFSSTYVWCLGTEAGRRADNIRVRGRFGRRRRLGPVSLAIIFCLFFLLLGFVTVGRGAGQGALKASKLTKNRRPSVVAAAGILSALLGALPLAALPLLFVAWWDARAMQGGDGHGTDGWLIGPFTAFVIVGCGTAAVMSLGPLSDMRDAPLCPTCLEYFGACQTRFLPLEVAPSIAAILDDQAFHSLEDFAGQAVSRDDLRKRIAMRKLAQELNDPERAAAPPALVREHCSLTLQICPRCKAGVLEAKAKRMTLRDFGHVLEEWTFRSIRLTDAQAAVLASAFFGPGGFS